MENSAENSVGNSAEKSVEKIRTHRVGTITAGLSMIVFGILFILHTIFKVISYQRIFAFWPLILMSLGIELLLSNFSHKKIVYDKGAVVILLIVVFFAIGMAITEVCLETSMLYYKTHII